MSDETLVLATKEAPYTQDDYPWGFQLRCNRRVWVEAKKGHGMRPMTQCQDPRNGRWCKPKAGVYVPFVVVVETAPNFVEFRHCTFSEPDDDKTTRGALREFEAYVAKYGPALDAARVGMARLYLNKQIEREAARKAKADAEASERFSISFGGTKIGEFEVKS